MLWGGTRGQLVLRSFLTPQATPSLPGSHLASTRGFFSTEWLLGTSGAGSRGVLGSLWKETNGAGAGSCAEWQPPSCWLTGRSAGLSVYHRPAAAFTGLLLPAHPSLTGAHLLSQSVLFLPMLSLPHPLAPQVSAKAQQYLPLPWRVQRVAAELPGH